MAQDAKNMDEDSRLQRIKFLVDQSKLYAEFLSSSIKSDPAGQKQTETRRTEVESKPEPEQRPKPQNSKGRSRKSKNEVSDNKQARLDSFFKPPAPKSDKQPSGIVVPLHSYQIDAIKWLTMLYQNGLNGILADEMGLGKTLEVIAFLAFLLENNVQGPFLIIAPLSTIGNWCNEFTQFAPSISFTKYYGPPQARAQLRRSKNNWGQALITSYEIIMADCAHLRKIDWKYIIVDEGHRLKNVDCKLMCVLKQYTSANRMLLTGTPLQNNLSELWALLNFLLPDVFTDLDIFHSWFESGEAQIGAQDENGLVTSLHDILRPFLLRRLKRDVGLNLPPKRECILFTGLSTLQQDLYKSFLDGTAREFVVNKIITEQKESIERNNDDNDENDEGHSHGDGSNDSRNLRKRRKIVSGQRQIDVNEAMTEKLIKAAKQELRTKSFSNLVMQLRLCCDSPYLFWYPWASTNKPIDERIETSSGKLLVLSELMKKLKAEGHRALIFSQFTTMLDVLEDWATFRGYKYSRIDGGTSQSDRQEMIDDFSKTSTDTDIFLLTTRSGGQGVNLVNADTVILFDSDWNPQQDLQAMDRVHRIGQTKPILVIRLCTGDTVEQDLLEKAAAKLELNHLVIESGKFKGPTLTKGTTEEKIANMGEQLRRHKIKFENGTGTHINQKDFVALLDRDRQAYERAQKEPKISDNIYCVTSEI